MSSNNGLAAVLAVVVVGIIYIILAAFALGFVYLAVKVAKYAWFGAWI